MVGDFIMIQQENNASFQYTSALLKEEKSYFDRTGGIAGHADEDKEHAKNRIVIFETYAKDMHKIKFLGIFPPAFPNYDGR